MIFALISDAMLGQHLRVDLVPPRFGVGQNAIEIENDGAELLRHASHLLLSLRAVVDLAGETPATIEESFCSQPRARILRNA